MKIKKSIEIGDIKMKKIAAFIACLLLLLAFSACRSNDQKKDSSDSLTQKPHESSTEADIKETPTDTSLESSTDTVEDAASSADTDTPVTEPPATNPPTTESPATNPPATNPPKQETTAAVKTCNHANTEVRNKKDATTSSEGCTGDTYCKDCGKLISSGSSIPKIKQTVSVSHDYYDAEMQVFNDINAERAKAGLNALVWDEALYAGTKVRVNEFYDWACGKHNAGPHNRPNGDEPYTAMWEYDNGTLKPFRFYGENCIGLSDYSKFASEWMDSDSHRPQILNEKYTRTAIAIIYCSDGLYYATQFFVG